MYFWVEAYNFGKSFCFLKQALLNVKIRLCRRSTILVCISGWKTLKDCLHPDRRLGFDYLAKRRPHLIFLALLV
jgi:hypothetical protein